MAVVGLHGAAVPFIGIADSRGTLTALRIPLTPVTATTTTVTNGPFTIANDGGQLITVESDLAVGTYVVHLGPLGTTADPTLFQESGQANRVTTTDIGGGISRFTAWVPPLDVGGPYSFTFQAVGASTTSVSDPLVTVIPHDFRSRVLSYRRLFPPRWFVGYRSTGSEEFPQS